MIARWCMAAGLIFAVGCKKEEDLTQEIPAKPSEEVMEQELARPIVVTHEDQQSTKIVIRRDEVIETPTDALMEAVGPTVGSKTGGTSTETVKKPPPDEVQTTRTGRPRPPAASPAGIKQLRGGSYEVSGALFKRWKDNPYLLGSVFQHEEGWRLKRMRTRHGYHLGFRNGDIITHVNGKALKTKAQLVSAYLSLKFKKEFDVTFLRNGQTKTYHISISK